MNRVEKNLSIVVLDDEPLVLSGISLLLEALGHQVDEVSRGEELLDLISKGKVFDLAILDLSVRNGLGGKNLAPQLAKIAPGTRLVVTSGYSTDEVMSDCRNFGFDGALPKPFSLSELEATIAQVMLND